MIRLSCHQDQY